MKMKPIGSEKLTGMDKIQRIIEIANYNTKNNNITESTTEYSKVAVDGNTYAIVREKDGYYVKVGLNESTLDYVDGILNKGKYRFDSYSGALRKINLMIKPLNEAYNDGKEDPVLNETKYVLKKPQQTPEVEPEMDMPSSEPEMDMPASEPEMDMPASEPKSDNSDFGGLDLGDEESAESEEMSPESSEEGDGDTKLKKVQKLTGKLGQSLRDMKVDIESSDIKYVLNSIISAIDLSKLNQEDLEDVMSNFEELDNFEIESDDMNDEPEDMDFGIEDDVDMVDDSTEEEINEFFSDSLEDNEFVYDNTKNHDSNHYEDEFEGDLDENAFISAISKLGPKFVDFYKSNQLGREAANGMASKSLKDFNPSKNEIDKLGSMIFGDLNENEVDQKIDNVLKKYFN